MAAGGPLLRLIQFYHQDRVFGWGSNFFASSIQVAWDGILRRYPTSEHYFQALKHIDNPEVFDQVVVEEAPGPSKDIARSRRSPVVELCWQDVKEQVMLEAVRAKFSQDEGLRNALMSTWDAQLVEHTRRDRYWGDGGDGEGFNALGTALMLVRAELFAAQAGCAAPEAATKAGAAAAAAGGCELGRRSREIGEPALELAASLLPCQQDLLIAGACLARVTSLFRSRLASPSEPEIDPAAPLPEPRVAAGFGMRPLVRVRRQSGDLLACFRTGKIDMLAHQTNCVTPNAGGLAKAVFKQAPWADVYRDRSAGRQLRAPHIPGTVIFRRHPADGAKVVANMMAQFHVGHPGELRQAPPAARLALAPELETPRVRLLWFRRCLSHVLDEAAKVAVQRGRAVTVGIPFNIGCGLAGGEWVQYESAIAESAVGLEQRLRAQATLHPHRRGVDLWAKRPRLQVLGARPDEQAARRYMGKSQRACGGVQFGPGPELIEKLRGEALVNVVIVKLPGA